ncbi:MAG: hypothetical protein K5910_08710 [Bacteroidales bacterium]|nr:hypothetical protein [Bacteroidales bacterium]
MKLQKLLFRLAGTLLAASVSGACAKETADPGGTPGPLPGAETELTVRLSDPETKVAAPEEGNEKMIRNLQVFVFRSGEGKDAGMLEIACSVGFDQELAVSTGSYDGMTLKCSTGAREVWVVVNDSRDRTAGADAVTGREDLLARTHDLADSRADKLLMVGSSGEKILHEGKEEIGIAVHRLAASVVLESVRNDFLSPAWQKSGVFRVEDCYLLNVPGVTDLGGSLDPASLPAASWYARGGAETAALDKGLIYDKVEPKTLEYGSSDATPHAFYAYPNPCGPSVEKDWCPRSTLLVLEASLFDGNDWVKTYYPVVLTGGLQSNRRYRVNLTVHRPGSTDPNIPVTFGDLTPSITVSDWETGEKYDPEI